MKISIDILENDIVSLDKKILEILLKDRTSKKNIIWATDDYIYLGENFSPKKEICIETITGAYGNIIQPRALKEKHEQTRRTKDKAEVFTPAWICNEQNNLVDECWFGRKNVFNIAKNKTWKTNTAKIQFPEKNKYKWYKYVDTKRLEISCGEAPYLVSRYDAVTGKMINLADRIGLLDRKLRIVNEHTKDLSTWYNWTKRAFQSVYGYEYQGDSLLLARENLLYTFIDNYKSKTNKPIPIKWLKEIATIISWNIWQMDGTTNMIPLYNEEYQQMDLFGNIEQDNIGQPCIIKDWRGKRKHVFKTLMKV